MSGLASVYDITMMTLQRHARSLSRLQEQAATGSRLIRASDSPSEAYAVLHLTEQAKSLETYGRNIAQVTEQLDQAASVLQEITTGMSRVRQLLTQAASATYSGANRAVIAAEVDAQLEHMLALANGKRMGQYLFGGANTADAPYEVRREGGRIAAVTYAGSKQEARVPLAPGVEQSGVLVGDRIFRNDGREAPAFFGATGIAGAAGTSTVRGDVWLTIAHDATSYSAGGIASGAGSGGDTIAGDHRLTVNVDDGTVALDDGPAVAFTAASTNLEVRNAAGDVAYVNMAGLDAGWTGTHVVDVSARAKASIDDGATNVVLDGSALQAVTDSRTGRVLYVDSSDLARVGVEPVRVTGTYDLFNTLASVRDLLLNTRGLSQTEQLEQLGASLGAVDEVLGGVTEAMTSLGGRAQALDNLGRMIADMSGTAGDQAARLRDVDVAQLAVELSRTQTFYQMTLASTSKLLNLSLLDYLK